MLAIGRHVAIEDCGIIKYIINGLSNADLGKTELFATLSNIFDESKI